MLITKWSFAYLQKINYLSRNDQKTEANHE